jgi:hypothetical protein
MTSSSPTNSQLAASLAVVTSPPSFSADAAFDSLPSSDLPPVQRIGSFSIPVQGWSLLRLDPPAAVVLHVGVEQLRVRAAGRWEPPEPEPYLPNTSTLPHPFANESHLDFARRYVEWTQPARVNPEWLKWRAHKVWIGQTIHELRDLIEADVSVPNECSLLNPNSK